MLLDVRDVAIVYGKHRAVDGVSFSVERGQTYALVGESGSGKSSLARAVMGLVPVAGGEIVLDGTRLDALSERQRRPYRRRLQMVFQDPGASLNPRRTILQTLTEPFVIHEPSMAAAERDRRAAEMVERVGLSPEHLRRYPHEFSGGQRQRLSLARALALRPDLLVLDEPTSALDVSVQAQILNLLVDLQRDLGLTCLFITHDLAVVAHMADFVGVMKSGRLVETGDAREVLGSPREAYTRNLLDSIPADHPSRRK